MTIEAHLASIDASLITIAAALTGIAEGAGVEAPKPTKTTGKKSAGSSTSGAKGKGKAATTDSKSTDEPEKSDGPKLEDVRTALTALQNATDGKTARELLAKVGGNGALSKIKAAKYQDIIDAAGKAATEAEEASD